MSKSIICRECNTPNTPGSKFCNNCGARLPISTNILCPNCQTPNPRNRLYCDNCGTRLLPDETAKPKKAEPKAEESPSSPKMFTLPTRKPGDTGELDPLKVPDWLKGGQTGKLPAPPSGEKKPTPSAKTDSPKPPPAGKKATADLPEWLVDTGDEELFPQAPKEITTEHFLNLVKRSEEEDSGFFIDDETTISGAGANLPDWLSDVSTPTPPAADMPSIPAGQLSEGAPEWLRELNQSPPEKKPEKPSFQPSKPKSETGELSEWLSELGPPNTDILSSPARPTSGYTQELPDWMDELGPPNTDILSGTQKVDEDLFGEADWLSDLGEPDSKLWTQETTTADSDLDWLEPPKETTAKTTNEFDEDDSLDWLTAEPSPTPTDQLDDSFDDWLQAETAEEPAQPEPEDDIWDMETQPTAEAVAPAGDGEDFDWLMADDSSETGQSETATWEDDLDWLKKSPKTAEPQAETPLADEPEEDFDAWLSKQSGILTEPAGPEIVQSGPLPGWLMGLDEKSVTSNLDDGLDDLFAADSTTQTSSLDWLTRPTDSLPAEEVPDFFALAAERPEQPAVEAEPDWLFEFGSSPLTPPETPVDETPILPAEPAETDVAAGTFFVFAEEPSSDEELAELPAEAFPEPSLQEEETLEEELPDWLQELGPRAERFIQTPPPVLENNLIPSEDEIPDWVANLKPVTGTGGSLLPNAFSSPEMTGESIEELPADFSGAALPEWLGDIPTTSAAPQVTAVPTAQESGLPDWLEPETSESAAEKAAVFAEEEAEKGLDAGSLLRDLPPPSTRPLAEQLAKADIPDWVQALKPKETPATVAGRLESSGPLVGLRGVIEVEPIIAKPRMGGIVKNLTISKEQEQHAVLLRQLAREATPSGVLQGSRAKDSAYAWLQLLLAILLIGVVVVGLVLPPLFTTPAPMTGVEAVHTALTAAAGEPVLVAFDYTPATAGELSPQAATLLAELAANGSPVIAVSQYAAGTAVASEQIAPFTTAPPQLLVGRAIGLRQLANCLNDETLCDNLPGYVKNADLNEQLHQVRLVIVLTGERESLLDWVEQVQSVTNLPMVAGVTQALGPVTMPYVASGQLSGVMEGLPGTAVYRQLYQTADDALLQQYNAQQMARLLAAGLLILGGFYYGTKAAVGRRKR